MMDFDKLIKEKAEQANYEYKPAAWRNFQRQTGFGRSTLKYWVAGVSSALLVGALITFLIVRESPKSSANDTAPCVSVCDTASLPADENTQTIADDTKQQFVPQKTTRETSKSTAMGTQQDTGEQNDTKAATTSSANPAPATTPFHGRPLVIDVDTIKDNVPSDEELRNGNSRLFD